MEGPIEISPDISGRNANDLPVLSTPVDPTTPIVTEAETTEAETRSPRTFLPIWVSFKTYCYSHL